MYNQAGITLAGMYNYFDKIESPLFENISVFEGGEFYEQEIPAIDKELLIDQIMEDNADLLTYRQIPDRFKKMVENFFEKNESNFAKMWIALNMDFNPIFNYDRYEDAKDKDTYNSATEKEGSETTKLDNSTGAYKEKTTPAETTTKFSNLSEESNGVKYTGVSADNAGASGVTTAGNYSPQTMEVDTVTPNKTTVEVDTSGETSFEGVGYTVNTYGKNINASDPRKDKHTGYDERQHDAHIFGNVGVTTSTKMIEEILSLYEFNMYNYISDLFAKELLFLIY